MPGTGQQLGLEGGPRLGPWTTHTGSSAQRRPLNKYLTDAHLEGLSLKPAVGGGQEKAMQFAASFTIRTVQTVPGATAYS